MKKMDYMAPEMEVVMIKMQNKIMITSETPGTGGEGDEGDDLD